MDRNSMKMNYFVPAFPDLTIYCRADCPRGISLAVAGSSGTGKTVLGLQFLAKGAMDYGEKEFCRWRKPLSIDRQLCDSTEFALPSRT